MKTIMINIKNILFDLLQIFCFVSRKNIILFEHSEMFLFCFQFGCCPLDSAVCCADGVHCCPEGSKCDLEKKACLHENVSQNSISKICLIFRLHLDSMKTLACFDNPVIILCNLRKLKN